MAEKKENEELSLEQQVADLLKKRSEITQKVDELLKKTPVKDGNLTAYLDDPKNYGPGEFGTIQKRREAMKKDLLTQLGTDQVKKQEEIKIEEVEKKAKRKGGSARKKWLKLD